jgi:hypothetical protein
MLRVTQVPQGEEATLGQEAMLLERLEPVMMATTTLQVQGEAMEHMDHEEVDMAALRVMEVAYLELQI